MHLNQKNLCALLDRLVSYPKLGPASVSIGANEKTIFTWLRRSAAGDPEFLVAWPDADTTPIQFVEAVKLARKMHLLKLDAAIREDVERGIPRNVVHEGKLVWVEDEALAAMSDQQIADAYELGAIDFPDRYLRIDGKRVPLTLYEPAPAALRVHAIRSLMPSSYNIEDKKTVTTTASVLVVGAEKRPESQLVQDLLRRIADLEANGPSNPKPTNGLPVVTSLSTRPTRGDDPPENVGRGPTADDVARAGGYNPQR